MTQHRVSKLRLISQLARELFTTTAIFGVAASLSSVITLLVEVPSAKEKLQLIPRSFIFIIIGTSAISILITFFVFLLRKRTAHVTKLKREVAVAFLTALDQSSFNPHRFEDVNEQLSPQTTK